MKLTEGGRLLIHIMKHLGASLDEVLGMMLALDTVDKQRKMLMKIADNPHATPSDLIGMTLEVLDEVEKENGENTESEKEKKKITKPMTIEEE